MVIEIAVSPSGNRLRIQPALKPSGSVKGANRPQLLTKIIEAIDMRREEVYICNILKCRPPGNRNPESDEIAACEQFLFRQIASVKPKVICTLGAPSSQTLLRTKEAISRLRGNLVDYRGAKLMATFHPAYLLRNPNEKRKVWEDMKIIRDYIASLA